MLFPPAPGVPMGPADPSLGAPPDPTANPMYKVQFDDDNGNLVDVPVRLVIPMMRHMVRQYFRAKSQDASPFLGISECPQGSDTETRDTMRRETRQYYSQVPVPPVPDVSKLHINVRVAQGTGPTRDEMRPTTQRSQASSIYSVSSGISPLVVGLASSGQPPRRAFAVTVDAGEATLVEELARIIENTMHHRFACVALFRGRTPLLFGQRVRDVLRANDTVVVYTGDDCCDAGTSQGSSSCSSDLVIIDFARGAAQQDDECLFVPLSETRMPRLRVSSALSAVSVGRVDMGPVGRVVSHAPLKVRFINVLVNPQLLRAFLGFCALPAELALESLLFVLDVERFRHVQPSMARLLANYIYLSYVAPGAPLAVNVSAMMRDRIPWPFLPGWEYNPWVFDEILASVGFMLKKHTLLRFERSPIGLVSVLGAAGVAEQYIKPLRLDEGVDPMAAIAEQYAPDIDVVVWVNELRVDAGGAVAASLALLPDAFSAQLLERITTQFVGDACHAASLCDGYMQLVSQLAPLQKQRKIKKTRKLRNFFGDNPHEALLKQQLMAVVPPSSQISAARAAAELVARKRTAENRLRACEDLQRQGSLSSSLIAEQKIMDSDASDDNSDSGRPELSHGWAHHAMHTLPEDMSLDVISAIPNHSRSWSDSTSSENADMAALRRNNGWTTDEDNNADQLSAAKQQQLRARSGVYNDQALSRALSMIGVAHADSQDSTSSDGRPSPTQSVRRSSDERMHSFSVYTAHAQSSQSLGRRSKFSRFERKRRADKLREFFGRVDTGSADEPRVPSLDDLSSATSSIPSMRSASFTRSDTPLTPEQRNILVRRRRKLRALLGEQVDECVVSFEANANVRFSLDVLGDSTYSLLTPEYTSLSSSLIGGVDASSSMPDTHGAQIRQYAKIRDMLGDNAPAPAKRDAVVSDEQRVRARWRRNKLVTMLGDVPSDVTTLYRTDVSRSSNISEADQSPELPLKHEPPSQQRQRVKKLRHFFGQSLNSDAMLMQGIARDTGRVTPSSDHNDVDNSKESFELVTRPTPRMPVMLPDVNEDALDSVKAQFWMTSSPESQESELPESNRRSSLRATLRAHKASIIGSIKRGSPSLSSQIITRSRASTRSSLTSSISNSQMAAAPSVVASSPGKLSYLSRKIVQASEGLRSSPRPSPRVPPNCTPTIRPLSPLPDISPNNLQASFDRGMALRDVPPTAPTTAAAVKYPPRKSSIAAAERQGMDIHRQLITSVLLSSAEPISTRTRRPSQPSLPPPRQSSGKSVHWFDQRKQSIDLLPPPPPPPSQTVSAKSSMELGMAIVLRSPSIKKPSIMSPVLSPQMAARSPPPRSRFPALPISSPTSGPRMILSHKASVSAVGGRQLSRSCESRRLPLASFERPPGNHIVTIRARRSHSFAIQRKLELATTGRKRANTIGTGRQAESQSTQRAKQDSNTGFPQADKSSRRVQSMILAQDTARTASARGIRNRCATVIPLHLELQRMLARRLATRRHTRVQQELAAICESNEDSANKPTSRMQSLRMTADALCVHDKRLRTSVVLFGIYDASNPQRRGSCQMSARSVAFSSTAATGVPPPYGRNRSMSCPGKFISSPRKRTPIQPAVARYLQSANAGYSQRSPRSSTHGSGPYQRISMALLSRPPTGRRSLDNRSAHRKLSPYMESSIRRFASLGNSNPSAHILAEK
ncbi:hypothetical protein IW147_002124 [Coemansia sp. RSA 720]|nr:hypothetical protein IW147_002124 [Coemansia sp. RSA 720]